MIKHHVAKVKYQKDIWEGISQTGFPVNSSTVLLITSPCVTLNDPFLTFELVWDNRWKKKKDFGCD